MAPGSESIESLTGRPTIEPALAAVWTHKQASADTRAPLRIYLGARILVVDDEPQIRRALQRALTVRD